MNVAPLQNMSRPRVPRRELIVAALLFAMLTAPLVVLKLHQLDTYQGDTAIAFQVTENIAFRGLPVTSVGQNAIAFLAAGIATMSPAEIAKNPLTPPPRSAELNILRWHGYFVFYPLALVVRVLPVNVVLFFAIVVSFTGLLLAAYLMLDRKSVV